MLLVTFMMVRSDSAQDYQHQERRRCRSVWAAEGGSAHTGCGGNTHSGSVSRNDAIKICRYMFTRLKTQGHSRPAVSDLPEWGVSQDEPYCSGAATKPHQHLQKCHVSTMKLFYYCGSCYNNNILNILLSLLNHIEISEREDWNDLPHVPEKDVSSNLLIGNFTCTLRLRVPPPPTG